MISSDKETVYDIFQKLGDSSFEPEADKFTFLLDNWPSHPGQIAKDTYAGFSQELKNYINQHLEDYAKIQSALTEEEKDQDIQYLDRFLSEFLSVPTCQGDQAPEKDLPAVEEAYRAMAQELRRFYGREEHDDEVPIW